MKKKIFLTTLIALFASVPAFASITPSEASSSEYLDGRGHSDSLVELVQINKAQINGETYVTKDEMKHANDSTFVKWVRKFFIYVDPALDDGKFLNHDTKSSQSYDDL